MSKEHAYAYEAGYRDGSINYELDHCPACKNVADLQEALDENAKLRESCAEMSRWYNEELKAALDENTKLLKLVQDLHGAYIDALTKCSGMEAGLIWEYSADVDAELAKSHARFEADYHRFDVAMGDLGIEART